MTPSVIVIEIAEDGTITAWCSILRDLGLKECDLKDLDGNPRKCDECYCG